MSDNSNFAETNAEAWLTKNRSTFQIGKNDKAVTKMQNNFSPLKNSNLEEYLRMHIYHKRLYLNFQSYCHKLKSSTFYQSVQNQSQIASWNNLQRYYSLANAFNSFMLNSSTTTTNISQTQYIKQLIATGNFENLQEKFEWGKFNSDAKVQSRHNSACNSSPITGDDETVSEYDSEKSSERTSCSSMILTDNKKSVKVRTEAINSLSNTDSPLHELERLTCSTFKGMEKS